MPSSSLELADDHGCFACGTQNPRGLHLKFHLDAAPCRLTAQWTPSKTYQGYADIVHGGMLALILDEMMVNLLWTLRHPAVTAELTVRFLKPARVGHPLMFEARIVRQAGRIIRAEATARTSTGIVVTKASARCVSVAPAEPRR